MTNILRDLDEDAAIGRLYLPREALAGAGIASRRARGGAGQSGDRPGLRDGCRGGRTAFRGSRDHHGAQPAPDGAHAAHHGDGLPHDVRPDARPRLAAAAQAGAAAPLAIRLDIAALRDSVMARSVHIIGAGLAGLATAVRLCGQGVHATVYEATNQAGGRCRSYLDPVLGITIDNGNHLLLSGNRAALGYLETIGARDRLIGPPDASFPFVDLATA